MDQPCMICGEILTKNVDSISEDAHCSHTEAGVNIPTVSYKGTYRFYSAFCTCHVVKHMMFDKVRDGAGNLVYKTRKTKIYPEDITYFETLIYFEIKKTFTSFSYEKCQELTKEMVKQSLKLLFI